MVLSAEKRTQLEGIFGAPAATGLSDDQRGELQSIFGEPEQKGFIERVGEDFQKREAIGQEIQAAKDAGEIGTAEALLQSAGKVGAGAVFDFLGEGVVSAGRGLSAIIPDFIEDPIVEGAKSAGVAFLNTDIGKAGLEAANSGIEAYNEFAVENPRAARNIESIVNIALLVSPVKGRVAPAKPTVIGKVGEKLTEAGTKQLTAQKKSFVDDLVKPKATKAVREEQVSRTTESGLLRQKQVALSSREAVLADEVFKIPGISTKKTLQGNSNVISKAVDVESKKLANAIRKNDVIFPRTEFKARLNATVKALEENPLLTGDAQKSAMKVANKLEQFTNEAKSTASGLLAARKKLDRWVRSQRGSAAFDPARENAISIAVRDIRQATNDFIDVKTTNVAVKESLKKQSNLLSALDNLKPKAAEEGANAAARLWQKASRILPIRGEANQALALGAGVGGLGAAAMFAPFVRGAFLTGGVAILGGKIATSPKTKKFLGQILKLTDQAIRKTKDKNLIRELRADRALVLEFLRSENE